jgi:hypothetical protein
MSKAEKLLTKFKAKPPPQNFSWDDLVTLMKHLGYQLEHGSGSRRSFHHLVTNHIITGIHEPHGRAENAVKGYQIKQIREALGL